jgi:hypothetical protein
VEAESPAWTFRVPTKDGPILVQTDNAQARDDWMRALRGHLATLVNVCRGVPHLPPDAPSPIEEAAAIFPRPFRLLREANLSASEDCSAQLNEWIDTMKRCRPEYERLMPQLLKSRFMLDTYVNTQDPVAFLDWFFGDPRTGAGGVKQEMDESEASVLAFLEKAILRHESAIESALEQRYFKEDVEKVLRVARIVLTFVHAYHRYHEEVLNSPQRRFLRQQQALTAAIAQFERLPYSSALQRLMFDDQTGTVERDGERWGFSREGRLSSPDRGFFFLFNGFNLSTEEDVAGGALWNTLHWVWFHPQLPFFIRYDYDRNTNTFNFHVPKRLQPGEVYVFCTLQLALSLCCLSVCLSV